MTFPVTFIWKYFSVHVHDYKKKLIFADTYSEMN